jgi:hypothetical protein
MVGTMVDPGGRHNSAVHGIAGGASSTPSLSALLVPSDHRPVQLLLYPWWKDGLTNNNSSSNSSLSWIFTKLQKEIQFLVNPSPPKKKRKEKSGRTLNTKSNLHFLSISLSRLTQHTIHFGLETKHKTHTHTHTQHNNTQKQKKSQKERNNSKSTNPKENVLFNTDFQSTTTLKFQQQQQI